MCVCCLQVFCSFNVDKRFCDKAFCQDQKHGCQVSIAFFKTFCNISWSLFIDTAFRFTFLWVLLLFSHLCFFVASHQLAALILYISNDYHIEHFPLNSTLGLTVKQAWIGFVIFYTSAIPTLVQRVDILYKVVFISMLKIHSVSHYN